MPSAASTRSPEQRESSAWQARFRKRRGTNQEAASFAHKTQTHQPSASDATSSGANPPPSIGEILLSALKAREHPLEPEEEVSRDCAEQLLGKRNAFVPELRMRDHKQHQDVEPEREGRGKKDDNDDNDMMASTAREIIQARFRCENQADELRHSQKTKTPRSLDAEAARKKTGAPTGVQSSVRPANATTTERSRRQALHGNRSMFELDVAPEPRQQRRPAEKPMARKTMADSRNRSGGAASNAAERERRGSSSTTSPVDCQGVKQHAPTRTLSRQVGSDPLRQMEERQRRLRDKRAARTQASARDPAIPTIASSLTRQTSEQRSSDLRPSSRNTRVKDDAQMTREQRLLQEKITRIAKENERAATGVEADWRYKQHALQQQRFVFSVWRQLLEHRQCQVMHTQHTFEWRWLQRVWTHWRQYALASQHARIEEATKANLVREKRVEQLADAFHRRKQLPIWFYRWSASATAAKDAR